MVIEARSVLVEGGSLEIDPFGFWPEAASRVRALGGTDDPLDPDYAFHTPYVICGEGGILFTARFTGLTAERGTLIVRINEYPLGSGGKARQIAVTQHQIRDLIRTEGVAELAGEARSGNSYALLGSVYGDAEVTAEGLAVVVERRALEAPDLRGATTFAAPDIRMAPRIVSPDRPSLAAPVSQLCTAAQLAEPAYRDWAGRLGTGRAGTAEWERVFVAQALRRYGFLAAGARGLGLGAAGDPLAALLAAQGCIVTATTAGEPGNGGPVAVRQADLADLPPTLAGFDFCWSTSDRGLAGDFAAAVAFIEGSLVCVKPGGLAIHGVLMDTDLRAERHGDVGTLLLTRPEIERAAMILISRGHQVAQVKSDPAAALPHGPLPGMPEVVPTAFAFVVRKSLNG